MAIEHHKKREYNKSTGRSYEYDTKYESSPLQKKRRAQRNAARKLMERKGVDLKGKDVDHIQHNHNKNLSNSPSNLRAISVKRNRGRH